MVLTELYGNLLILNDCIFFVCFGGFAKQNTVLCNVCVCNVCVYVCVSVCV